MRWWRSRGMHVGISSEGDEAPRREAVHHGDGSMLGFPHPNAARYRRCWVTPAIDGELAVDRDWRHQDVSKRGNIMHRMLRVTLGSMALVLTATTTLILPASADTPDCVTRAEYRKVHRGDSKPRVHRIFDVRGKREAISSSGGYKSEIRSYRTCSRFSAVSIAWEKKPNRPWRLSAKSAVWSG